MAPLRAVFASALLAGASSQCFPAPVVTTSSRLFTTGPSFASWTIDPSRNRAFFNVDFRDPRLVYLASQIGGGVIRFGGGGADTTLFATEAGGAACANLPAGFECLNTTTLDALLDLSAAARARLVVGLALCPSPDGPSSWNATVAAAEIAHIREHSTLPILAYEYVACVRRRWRLRASYALTKASAALNNYLTEKAGQRVQLAPCAADGPGDRIWGACARA